MNGSRNGHDPTQGVSRLSVSGYKSLYDETSIEIRPLTILAGANSSGKSSIMEPLLLMKQTLEAAYEPPAALKIDGPNITFSATDQFLSRTPNRLSEATLTVEIVLSDGVVIRTAYRRSEAGGLGIAWMEVRDRFPKLKEPLRIRPEMTAEELAQAFPIHLRPGVDELRVERQRCFLAVPLFVAGRRGGIDGVFPQTAPVVEQIRALLHVPAARAGLERTVPLASPVPPFPGPFAAYVAALLNAWQRSANPRFLSVRQALQTLGLTRELQVRQVNEVQAEIFVGRLPPNAKRPKSDTVNIADVGSGVSAVLPVLVALFAAEPGQLVYLAEPEMDLHPRAQSALAEIVSGAAKRGVRVVAETHSSLLLLSIEALVAEGRLDPALVKLHWFSRDRGGMTHVSSGDLDEAGRFGDWPVDFADVELDAEKRYLDAADRVLWKQAGAG